jgi:hypothetical protein
MLPDLHAIFSNSFRTAEGDYSDLITDKEIELLFQHKLFKCFLPESLGGLALDLPATLRIIQDAAYINGSLGWLVQIGNGGMYFATNFDEKLAEKFLQPANAVISGSGTPTAKAVACEGGYMLSGSWKYCSGSAYATLFTVTFTTDDSDEILSAVVPRKEVKVINDWDTIGMRNTSTNTIQLENVFLSNDQLFKVSERKAYFNEPALSLPFILYAQAFFIHVVFGVFDRLLTEAEQMLPENTSTSERVKKCLELIQKGRISLETSKKTVDSIVLKILAPSASFTEEEELAFQQTFIEKAKEMRVLAAELYASMGIEVIYRNNPVAICYMDLVTVSQHKLLNA